LGGREAGGAGRIICAIETGLAIAARGAEDGADVHSYTPVTTRAVILKEREGKRLNLVTKYVGCSTQIDRQIVV
jgi:hypothetical protein